MRNVLIFAVAGMLALLLGIFSMVSGNLTENPVVASAGFVGIAAGLGLIGWSVVDRNRRL